MGDVSKVRVFDEVKEDKLPLLEKVNYLLYFSSMLCIEKCREEAKLLLKSFCGFMICDICFVAFY